MLYYPQTNRQEVYEMTAPKKPPITKSFGYAFEGIFTCIRKERNMKIHCIMAVLVVIAGIILKLSPVEWCICLGLFGLVMALELVNTAVESVVDLVTSEYKPLAKIAKDTAAGAVLIAAIMAAIAGLIIFVPKGLVTPVSYTHLHLIFARKSGRPSAEKAYFPFPSGRNMKRARL